MRSPKLKDETINFVCAMVMLVLCIAFMIGYSVTKEERDILRNENLLLKSGYTVLKIESSGEFEASWNGSRVNGYIKDGKIFVSK